MLAKHARVLGMCDIELVRVSVSHSDNWPGCKGGIERSRTDEDGELQARLCARHAGSLGHMTNMETETQ